MTHYKVIKTVIENARVRHYHSGDHIPYRGMLHDRAVDKRLNWRDPLLEILSELPEGSVVSIQVLVQEPDPGEIDPEDTWVRTDAHTYAHKSESSSSGKGATK